MRLRSKTELAGLAVLAYLPFLASSPGQVSADSRQDLYLDPARALGRSIDLWDPHVGAGTVPHQSLGYVFPTGPWFWALDRLGVPDWLAQRLWLGTISLAAVLGARWLFRQLGVTRTGALAGALVYLLTPYQLAFTARMSVLLLPWAALPWLVGLTTRATRTRDWHAAALAALVLVAAGGINASSLVVVGVAPALWVLLELGTRTVSAARVLAATGRLAALGLGVSLWWLVGLRLQGSYGLPVLQLTENVREVARFSTPGDLLRGLGNWFFYGRDRTGYSIDQAADYASGDLVIALSYVVPAVGFAAAFLLRWAHRRYFGLLVVLGTVIGVGAWPYDDATPYGSAWKAITRETSIGLALRNTPRIVPVIALGLAGLLAGAVAALPPRRWQPYAAAAVVLAALSALLPVWRHGFLTDGMQRPEDLPAYWLEAATALDAGDPATRVLEIPGSSFAAYRWGTTVDPITPGLIDRPYLAREVLPAGTPGTANLLDALDRRMQQGTFEPAALAPVARLFGVGTVVLRADLDRSGRFDTPDPAPIWHALTAQPNGLESPRSLGPPGSDGGDVELPSVALFDVTDPRPIVRTAPSAGSVLLEGDGDGIVDAAAARVLDGSALVLEAAALDDGGIDEALRADAHLVVTDSNRRRAQTWFYSLRDTKGPTERAGRTEPDPTGYDFRLDPFPGSTDASRTVVEQVGGAVEATSGGGPERPEDRAAHAVDGDPSTAWRVAGADPRGAALTLVPAEPVETGEVRLVQPPIPEGGRALARVAVTVDSDAPIVVELGPESRTPAGQAVTFSPRAVERVRVQLLETTPPAPVPGTPSPVGLAELRLGSLTVDEVVRLPVRLLEASGRELRHHRLDIVLTRLRVDLPGTDRSDEETHLDRRVELPVGRSFALHGVVRPVDPAARTDGAQACRDDLVQVDGAPVAVRLEGAGETASVSACAPLDLDAGSHRITTAPGDAVGVEVDRLVLTAGADGRSAVTEPGPTPQSGAEVTVRDEAPAALDLDVATDGSPFWLVLGQSNSSGWDLDVEHASVGPRRLVDGYANGWLVTPDEAGTLAARLRWTPQRLVPVGFAASGLALGLCLLVVWRHRGRAAPCEPPLAATPHLKLSGPRLARAGRRPVVTSALVGIAALAVAPPIVVGASVFVLVAASLVRARPLALAAVAPVALLVSRAGDRPSLAWLTVLLLAGDLALGARRAVSPGAPAP